MLRITILLCLIIFSTAQDCPETFPDECNCQSSSNWPNVNCITIPLETWDIKATFDEITSLMNRTLLNRVVIDANLLGQEQEVPVDSISELKATSLTILANHKFTRIDPGAFSGSHLTVQFLYINQMTFQSGQEAFDLINNFGGLQLLDFYDGTTITEIPAYAFDADHNQLTTVNLNEAGVTSIGDLAFAALPSIVSVQLIGNNLTLDGISDTAFTFATEDVQVVLERNPGITHLPQEKFENFLSGNKNFLFVGPELSGECNPQYFLHCDERMDWFCDTEITRVYGYFCMEAQYVDIYGYCAHKFGYSPLTRIQNTEDLERIELEDRLRRETLRVKQKYHRGVTRMR